MSLRAAKSGGRIVNVASVPHRSPFRYPGGKTWLVPEIRKWMHQKQDKPREFIEPFAGGAIAGLTVLFEGLCERLTIVEKDEDVAAVWRTIINGKGQKLADEIVKFEMSKEAVNEALKKSSRSLFDRAFSTIIKNRVQRGGILAPGASLMKNGENGRGLASRWYPETLKKRILAIVEMRKKIHVIQGDGIEVIRERRHDEHVVFFIDPPYVKAGRRLYKYSDVDHEELFKVASEVKGDVLMSYDNDDGIRDLAGMYGFEAKTVRMKNTHHNIMDELLIGRDLSWMDSGSDIGEPVSNSLFESLLTDRPASG